jgi:hypothetical protein
MRVNKRFRLYETPEKPTEKSVTISVDIYKDCDGWWGELDDPWCWADNPGCGSAHEDTKKELNQYMKQSGVYSELPLCKHLEAEKWGGVCPEGFTKGECEACPETKEQ